MALEDTDMIDRAMDAAEAKTIEVEAPTVDREVEAAETKIYKEATEKPAKSRDTSGKFSKEARKIEAIAPQEPDITDQDANVEQEAAVEIPPSNLPTFWPDELKRAAAEAPKAVVDAFVKHDAQREEWAQRTAREGQRGRAFEQRMYEGYEPQEVQEHRAKLQMHGLRDEVEELHRYRAWDTIFQTDVRTGIADLMHKNGLTPYDLMDDQNEVQQYQTDPRIEEELEDLRRVKEEFEQFQTTFKQQEETSFYNAVEAFKNGVDSTGQNRKQFAELYAPQITQSHQQIQQQYPQLSFEDALNYAYEQTLSEVRKLHGAPAPKASAPDIVANSKKAKSAASSVVGSPRSESVTAKPRAKSFDEAFARAEELVYGGR